MLYVKPRICTGFPETNARWFLEIREYEVMLLTCRSYSSQAARQ